MLVSCMPDVESTLTQHCFNVSCSLGGAHDLQGHIINLYGKPLPFLLQPAAAELLDAGQNSRNAVNSHQCAALQNQKAVSAYFTTKQILPFGFARLYIDWRSCSGLIWCRFKVYYIGPTLKHRRVGVSFRYRNMCYLCPIVLANEQDAWVVAPGCSGMWTWIVLLQGEVNGEKRQKVIAYNFSIYCSK